jgi:hypothetical protein
MDLLALQLNKLLTTHNRNLTMQVGDRVTFKAQMTRTGIVDILNVFDAALCSCK